VGREDDINEAGVLQGTRIKYHRHWDLTGHHIIVPRMYIPPSMRADWPIPFIDHRPSLLDYHQTGVVTDIAPRDEIQEEALGVMMSLKNEGGTINLACGRGKTALACMLTGEIGVPALAVVNQGTLIAQWREEISEFLSIPRSRIGVIQRDTCQWEGYPFVIATVQTLAQRVNSFPLEMFKYFGLVFYDEAHHMSAPFFVRAASPFWGTRFSLTATPFRLDGKEAIYQYHLGEVVMSNLEQDIIPETIFHEIEWPHPVDFDQCRDVNGNINTSRTRTYITQLEWRNALIARHARADVDEGRQLLVLSHGVREGQLEALARLYGRRGRGVIHGNVKQDSQYPCYEGSTLFSPRSTCRGKR